MSHPQGEGSQEVPTVVRVGVKEVAVLSSVLVPETTQGLLGAELSQSGESP